MTLLESPIEPAAESRSFYTPKDTTLPIRPSEILTQSQAFKHTEKFWLEQSGDLLNYPHSCIIQAGLNQAGELVDLEDDHVQILTLTFDQTHQKEGVYHWRLTTAQPGHGREVTDLTVQKHELKAVQKRYDQQGRQRGEVSDYDGMKAFYAVQQVLASEPYKKSIEDLRQGKIKEEMMLSRWCIQNIGTYSAEKYGSELEKLQKRVDSVGFSRTS